MDGKRKTHGTMGGCSEGRAEHPSQHKAHGEQPPAAARAGRFAAKYAPAGQRQIRTVSGSVRAGHWDDYLPAPASASGSGKNGFGRFRVSDACGPDLVCLYRVSPPLSMP
jgi:hypothetical protein